MATIPNASSLNRTIVQPTETVQKVDTSMVGKKAAIYSKAASDISGDMMKLDEIDAEFESSVANAKMFEVYSNTLATAERENDEDGYLDLPERYGQEVKNEQSKILEGMKNRRAKAMFEAAQSEKKVQLEGKLKEIAYGKEKVKWTTHFNDQLNMLKSKIGTDVVQDIAATATGLADVMVKKGYYAADEMQKMMTAWKSDTALAGIDMMDDPDKKLEALNTPWIAENTDATKRGNKIESVTKEVKAKKIDLGILDAVNKGKTHAQVIKNIGLDDNIPLQDKPDAIKKALELRNNLKAADTEAKETVFQNAYDQIEANPRDANAILNSKAVIGLDANQQEFLKQKALLTTSPVASDPIEHNRVIQLIEKGRYDEARTLAESSKLIASQDKETLLKNIAEKSIPAVVEINNLLDAAAGKPSGKTAIQRRARESESLLRWRNQYVDKNQREPTTAEFDEQVIMITSKYRDGYFDIGEPNLYVADAPYEEQSKIIDNIKKDSLKEEYEDYYDMVEEGFSAKQDVFENMTSFQIKDHIDKVIENPVLYQDTMDLINSKGLDADKDFDAAYNYLKNSRKQKAK
jgi:hypothetical protein